MKTPLFSSLYGIVSVVLAVSLNTASSAAERTLLSSPSGGTLAAASANDSALSHKLMQLRTLAKNNGNVRVIVGVRAAFAPEEELAAAGAQAQRLDINSVQTLVSERLASIHNKKIEITRFETIPFLAMAASAAEFDTLLSDDNVLSVEEDALSAATLAESSALIGANTASSLNYGGAGQVVAILDTGVDKTHPFLSGKVISEACYSSNYAPDSATTVCPGGVTASTASGSGVNCGAGCDHGTHVAGIATGLGGGFSGVARNANLIAVQVFSRFNSSVACGGVASCVLSYSSDQIKGLERVYALRGTYNIAAVNMSLGGGRYYNQATCDTNNAAFKTAVDNLRAAGIATVISSGNSGYTDSMGSPGCVSSAISVGSTWDAAGLAINCEASSAVDKVACYSNSVSFLNLLAPGSAINSSIPGGAYAVYHGTSMAAPQVTGAWALLKQASPGISVTDALAALANTGVSVTDYRNGIVKPRIDLVAALNSLGAAVSVVQFSSANYSVTEGGVAVLTVNRSGNIAGTSTVEYGTGAETAAANVDYTITYGTLTFAPGETTKTISVPTMADSLAESNETFRVVLLNPSAGTVIGGVVPAMVTIINSPESFGSSIPAGWKMPAGANSMWGTTNGSANEGSYSLKSAATGNSQSSGIEYRANFKAGVVSFDYRVSSEANYDYLRFYIDGVLNSQWSGEVGWTNYSTNLTAGVHTLRWIYQKDGSVSINSDAAWIDNIQLPANTKISSPWLMLLLD